jgi:plasmid maintenance system antidote protein VapI
MNQIQLGQKLEAQYTGKGWSVGHAASMIDVNYQAFLDLCAGIHQFTRAIRAKLAEVFKDETWLMA